MKKALEKKDIDEAARLFNCPDHKIKESVSDFEVRALKERKDHE